MALDSGYLLAAQALPTPTDTLYESPIVGVAKRSSRQGPPSTFSNYSSAPFPPNEDSYFARQHGPTDEGNEDRFSTNDARRLSPNLGLSLVSQIHTLNKQLEDKRTIVDSLEDSLHHTRADNEQLTVDLNAQRIEVRSVKKQMQSLENDMLKALEDIATERDNAIESIADTRRRLEVSTKKIRVQEEDVNRTHILWEKDKQDWDDKKRELEGRIHTAEERLKTMVEEMLVVQNTSQTRPGTGAEVDECVRDTCFIRGNDASSIRAPSRLSNRSTDDINMGNETLNFRSSRMSGLHELGGSKMSGLSLAEELDISENDDSDNDVQDESEDRGIGSLGALPEETSMLSRHYSDDKKAKKAMEFHADSNKQLFGDDSSAQHMVIINDYINFPAKQLASQYTDTATQCSPHLSPTLREAVDDVSEKPAEQTERTANQSRKRAAMPQIAVEQASNANKGGIQRLRMASTACQTMPQSSSFIAKVTNDALASVSKAPNEMKSSSTQTTDDATMISRSATSRPSPSPMDVPVIAIHPPASRPSSSHTSVVLPPRTRNAACQVVIVKPTSTRSTSMQTEEIRVDRRRVRVPPRLQSPNVTAQFLSQQTECLGESAQTTGPEAVKRTFPSPPPIEAGWTLPRSQAATGEEAYRGKNDNGPLTNKQPSGPRRPIRSESIFAGFADVSDNDTEKAPNDYSDDEFLNAAPIRKTLSKVQNSWKLVPQSKGSVLERLELASEEVEAQEPAGEPPKITRPKDIPQTTSKTFQTKAPKVSQRTSNTTKPTDNRRGAFVANGIHKGKGPTVPNGSKKEAVAVAPPFPVPTRFSSRNIPLSASDGAASPSPYVTNFFSARPSQGRTRPTAKRQTIRKVQSAAAVSTSSGPRRSQPVSSMSAASTVPGSPKSPGLGQNQFILPYESVAKLPSQSTPSRSGAGEASIEPPCEQTSVVDAIAQTMVGEWMWKYVRKRTSFGITDNPQAEFEMGRTGENGSSSSVRHKRWVWLAPFERAVIWNSKQPTSGPALLGKGGRKLTIQSVLDVKDDTPLPKNAGSQSAFDRSILILTPQRALKFTAVSRERHYIWLTALSFLSHPSQGMDDLASPPPVPQQEYQRPRSQAPVIGPRRTPIRDSIRVAKAKSRPTVGVHSYSSPTGVIQDNIVRGAGMAWEDNDVESEDAAEPPQVPRVAAHIRKRSSTGSRPVPLSPFQSYLSDNMATSLSSTLQAPTSREKYDRYTPEPRFGSGPNKTQDTLIGRITESSTLVSAPVVPDNFFDQAAGTVRMEAFIGKENGYIKPRRGDNESWSYGTRQRRKKDWSYWGGSETVSSSVIGSPPVRDDDPFTAF